MNKITYKGTSYLDVIANNVKKGGKIMEVRSFRNSEYDTHQIVTDYADGLSIFTDEMIYKDDVLQLWTIKHDDDSHVIFSREEFDYYLTYWRTKGDAS